MLTSDNKIIIAARNYTCQIACTIIDNVYFYTADYYKHEIFLRIFLLVWTNPIDYIWDE